MDLSQLEHDDSFRGKITSVDKFGNRKWVYAHMPKGEYYNRRKYIAGLLLVIFFSLPFVHIDNTPLVQLNIPEGRFILLGKIFWPQDFFIFAVAMITFIIFISLFTVIYGRLFCGWACPQTIFMEFIFRKIEWWIEGNANKQKQLNASTWNFNKIKVKFTKHALFILISYLISMTFLAYIVGIDKIWNSLFELHSISVGIIASLAFFTLAFYATFAFARDLVCTTVCPYGRLQSVLFDKDTMLIAYDYKRGEPRGKIFKDKPRKEGDCIDCKKCILVCPTGIDIRNGVQLDCVACTACIDACNEVMDKIGFKRGLIRYASENLIANLKPFKFNDRMKAYSILLVTLVLFTLGLIVSRKTVDIYISRVKGQLLQELPNENISNLYEAKIINKSKRDIKAELRLIHPDGNIRMIGDPIILLNKESTNQFTFFIELPNKIADKRNNKIHLGLFEGTRLLRKIETNFLGKYKSLE